MGLGTITPSWGEVFRETFSIAHKQGMLVSNRKVIRNAGIAGRDLILSGIGGDQKDCDPES